MADITTFYPTITETPVRDRDIKVWTGTEAEYRAITTPDPNTLYFTTI